VTNDDVLEVKRLGSRYDVIVAKIKPSPGSFRIDTKSLTDLSSQGLSEAVISAMLVR